jgi:microcystin-dependent protein
MKKLIASLLILLNTGLITVSLAALSPSDQAMIHTVVNFPSNPGFENGTAGWVASAGFGGTSSGPHTGNLDGTWQPAASTSSQNFLSTAQAIPPNLLGQNCVAGFFYIGNTATAANGVLQFEVVQSSTVLGSVALPTATGTWGFQAINFVCPSSGNLQVGLQTTATTSGSGQTSIALDDFFVVDARFFNIGSGTNVSDYVAYTPTFFGFGTVTAVSSYSRRVGDSLEGLLTFTAGTVTGTTSGITLGSNGTNGNVTIDPNKISAAAGIVGHWVRSGGTSGQVNNPVLASAGGSQIGLGFTGATQSGTGVAAPNLLIANGETVSLYYSVPITGWTSGGSTFLASSGGLNAGDELITAATSCPLGTIPEDGSSLLRASYPGLFSSIGTTYGSVDGTHFTVPDARGVWERGAGTSGTLVNSNGAAFVGAQGTNYNDQMQGHIHDIVNSFFTNGGGTTQAVPASGPGGVVQTTGAPITDGTNGTPRVGADTHPASISHLHCIRYVAASPSPVLLSISTAQITGTTAVGNATAGNIGEFVSANPGSPVSVGGSGSPVTITSISLTPGDWDVNGLVELNGGASTAGTTLVGSVSLNPTSQDNGTQGGVVILSGTFGASSLQESVVGNRRINISTTTTIYLIGQLNYSVAGGAAWGTNSFIQARRVR